MGGSSSSTSGSNYSSSNSSCSHSPITPLFKEQINKELREIQNNPPLNWKANIVNDISVWEIEVYPDVLVFLVSQLLLSIVDLINLKLSFLPTIQTRPRVSNSSILRNTFTRMFPQMEISAIKL